MTNLETTEDMPDVLTSEMQSKNSVDPTEADTQAEEPVAETKPGGNIDALMNVKLDVRVVLGHSRMSIAELLALTKGSVIELDRKIGEPIDLMINDRTVARGDLVKVNGDFIGVALREIVKDLVPSSL